MQQIFFWFLMAGGIFIIAIIFFFRAVVRKSMQHIYFSLLLLLIACVMGGRGLWLFITRSYHAVTAATAPRNPAAIYRDLLGKGNDCVSVLHVLEPTVPRIDCCTYLEVNTCPAELRRILSQHDYRTDKLQDPPGNKPGWWRNDRLGAGAQAYSRIPHEDSYELLLFSADSSHAFYCYSTD